MCDVNKKILWIIEESSHWKQSKLIRQIYNKVKKKSLLTEAKFCTFKLLLES